MKNIPIATTQVIKIKEKLNLNTLLYNIKQAYGITVHLQVSTFRKTNQGKKDYVETTKHIKTLLSRQNVNAPLYYLNIDYDTRAALYLNGNGQPMQATNIPENKKEVIIETIFTALLHHEFKNTFKNTVYANTQYHKIEKEVMLVGYNKHNNCINGFFPEIKINNKDILALLYKKESYKILDKTKDANEIKKYPKKIRETNNINEVLKKVDARKSKLMFYSVSNKYDNTNYLQSQNFYQELGMEIIKSICTKLDILYKNITFEADEVKPLHDINTKLKNPLVIVDNIQWKEYDVTNIQKIIRLKSVIINEINKIVDNSTICTIEELCMQPNVNYLFINSHKTEESTSCRLKINEENEIVNTFKEARIAKTIEEIDTYTKIKLNNKRKTNKNVIQAIDLNINKKVKELEHATNTCLLELFIKESAWATKIIHLNTQNDTVEGELIVYHIVNEQFGRQGKNTKEIAKTNFQIIKNDLIIGNYKTEIEPEELTENPLIPDLSQHVGEYYIIINETTKEVIITHSDTFTPKIIGNVLKNKAQSVINHFHNPTPDTWIGKKVIDLPYYTSTSKKAAICIQHEPYYVFTTLGSPLNNEQKQNLITEFRTYKNNVEIPPNKTKIMELYFKLQTKNLIRLKRNSKSTLIEKITKENHYLT